MSGKDHTKELETFFIQAPAAIAFLEGSEHIFTFVNPWYQELFSRKEEELIGYKLLNVFPELKEQGIYELFNKAYQTGEPFRSAQIAAINQVDKSQKTYYQFLIQPVKNDTDDVTGLVVYSYEVTAQMHALKKAEERESQLKLIADAVPVLISYVDKDGYYRFNNKAYETWFGHSQNEIHGKHLTEVLGEDAFANIQSKVQEVLSGKRIHFETLLPYKDGGERYVSATYVPHFGKDNEVLGFFVEVNDITELKNAQTTIKKSEQELKDLANAMAQLLWIADTNGNISYFNNRIQEFAIADQANDSKNSWINLVHHDDVLETTTSWNTSMKSGNTYTSEQRMRMADGSYKWHLTRAIAQKNETGQIIKWYGTATDIHEQRVDAEKLRASEERFEAAVNAVQGILWTNNAIGEMEGEQPGWTALTGQKFEEYQGYGWANAVHPEDAKPTIDAWQEALKERKTFEFEHRLRTKNEGWRWFGIKAVPILNKDGSIREWVGVHTDVTEQRKAQNTIRESEERFRLMADASPVMIWTLDAMGNSIYYNKKALEFTGHTEEDLQAGKTWQMAIHPDDIQFAGQLVSNAVQNKQPYQMECRMKRADHEWRWLLSHGMPRLNEKGELLGYVGSSVDITERKIAEEALKASEDRYQNFIRQSTEGIWRFELSIPLSVKASTEAQIEHFFNHAYLAECNDAMAHMYGYNSSEELKELRLDDFFKRDEDTQAYFTAFINAGYRVENIESKEMDRHGNTKYYSNNLVGIIENDLILRAWGTQRDITAQKFAEENLARSEQYFRQLTDTVPAIIWITRPDGYCTYLNKNWYDYTGQTPGEAEGFGWLNATHPDDAAEAEKLFVEATMNQQPYYILYRLRHKEGGYRWAIDSGQPKFGKDGTFEGMMGTVIDVHEQKLAEDKIKESERKFRTLAETLPQLVWMTDDKGVQEYASSRWKEYTGITPTGADSWKQIVHPDDWIAISKTWVASMEKGSLYKIEARLKNKNGRYRWHFVHGEPIFDTQGKIIKWIGAFTDIHDQKTISEKLEALVVNRTKELQRSNEDLQQFAHVASHDLKEPLRKIKIFAGRLEKEDNENLSSNGKSYLEKINTASDRMFTMIDGVLTYSTLNAIAQIIDTVNLEKIIRAIESDLELVIHQKNATITQHNLPQIQGAEVLLYQLFYNLINNSLKFSRSDVPSVISIEAESFNEDNEEYTQIVVQDNGIGFEPKQSKIIFGTFERLHAKDKYDGTGLGLALCKKIAERHGGSITAEGNMNQGAKFIIVLPLKQKQSSI